MSHALSHDQIIEFDRQGYLRMAGQIPLTILQNVKQSAEGLLAELQSVQADNFPLDKISFCTNHGQRLVHRVNNLTSFMQPELLILLGCPQLLDIAESICGPEPIIIYESLVVHHLSSADRVILHQDMIHDKSSRIITFGIHLDESGENDGCLRVAPGLHHYKQNINQLNHAIQSDELTMVSIGAQPGDLLLHDVMIPHDVHPLTHRQQRKTIYLEFRSAEHVMHNPIFNSHWLAKRQALTALAKRIYDRFCNHESITLNNEEGRLLESLQQMKIQVEAANYAITEY